MKVRVYATINEKVKGTQFSPIEGRSVLVKRKGIKKSVIKAFDILFSIKNEYLNFEK